MKHTTFAIVLSSLVLWSCSKSSSTSKKDDSSSNPLICASNPYAYGCQGSTTGTTTSGTTSGTTTGTTSGGTSGGNYSGIADSNTNWSARYNATGKPTAPSTVNCQAPQNQATGPNYTTRKGTIHMAFQKAYRPDLAGLSGYSNNISYFLTDINSSKTFLESDGLLKVRFMPRPQRVPSAGEVWCYGRRTGSGSGTAYGYTELSYSVGVYGVQGGTLVGPLKTYYLVTGIQSCSPAVDFSGFAQSYPDGIVLSVFDVQSNQGCSSYPCSAWSATTSTCWGMDIEVATDSTQTF